MRETRSISPFKSRQEVFPFLKLPLEIRYKIYHEVLVRPWGWIGIGKHRGGLGIGHYWDWIELLYHQSGDSFTHYFWTPILSVNRQIYNEAISVLYRQNKTYIAVYPEVVARKDWKDRCKLLKTDKIPDGKGYIHPHTLARLTNLEIIFELQNPSKYIGTMTKELKSLLRAIHKYLKKEQDLQRGSLTMTLRWRGIIRKSETPEMDGRLWGEFEKQGVISLLREIHARRTVTVKGHLIEKIQEQFVAALANKD